MNHQLPTNGHRPELRLSSLRKIQLGIIVGIAIAGAVVVLAERRVQQRRQSAVREARAQAFTGPQGLAMRQTIGSTWLALPAALSLPLMADRAEINQRGSGYSSARGGTGSSWGRLAEMKNAALPPGTWSELNTPVARAVHPSFRLVYPLDARQSASLDPRCKSTEVVKAVPGSLRYRDRDN